MKLLALTVLLFLVGCTSGKMGAAGAVPGDPVWLYGSSIDGGLPVNATFGGTVTTSPATPCTPVQFYGTQTGVIKDAGGLFFMVTCYNNTSANTQYLQLQNGTTQPLVDAGPPALEYPILASGVTIVDQPAPGGVNMASGLAFDISATSHFYTQDAGGAINCSFCYQ